MIKDYKSFRIFYLDSVSRLAKSKDLYIHEDPKTGFGVYARRDLPKGYIIDEVIIPLSKECSKMDPMMHYHWIGPRLITGLGLLANGSCPMLESDPNPKGVIKYKANAILEEDDGKDARFRILEDIPAGTQIILDYGDPYFYNIHKELRPVTELFPNNFPDKEIKEQVYKLLHNRNNLYKSLAKVREELVDSDLFIKSAFNSLVNYFKDQDDSLYFDYLAVVNQPEYFGVWDKIKDLGKYFGGKLKEIGKFLEEIKEGAPKSVNKWIEILKNKKIFKFFQKIGFSLKKFYDFVKKGFDACHKYLLDPIAEYVRETKVGKWTRAEVLKLDKWLKAHPKLKRVTGVAVAALLIYINLNMSYLGDYSYDFNMDDVVSALEGNFLLTDIFTSTGGTKMLMLLVTGVLGISFPWNGPTKLVSITTQILYSWVKKQFATK